MNEPKTVWVLINELGEIAECTKDYELGSIAYVNIELFKNLRQSQNDLLASVVGKNIEIKSLQNEIHALKLQLPVDPPNKLRMKGKE